MYCRRFKALVLLPFFCINFHYFLLILSNKNIKAGTGFRKIDNSFKFLCHSTDASVDLWPPRRVSSSPASWIISNGLTKSCFCTMETATSTAPSQSSRLSDQTSAPSSSAWKLTTTSTQSDAGPFSQKPSAGSPLMKPPASEDRSQFGSLSVSPCPQ